MNERPTPETDEQINGKPCTRFSIMAGDSLRDALVPSEFARKLERQRDEALEKLAEARRESENLAKSIYRSEYSDNDTGWELLESVAGVISQINNMYAGVREQRDEAREALQYIAHSGLPARFLEDFAREFLKKKDAGK